MPRPITRQGFDAIQQEIDFLWSVERPRIVEQVHAAAELGDRSENAEYIYGKRRLREINSRLGYLRRKIEDVVVVDLDQIKPTAQVKFGALVTVVDDDGEERTWRLVDQEESDPKKGMISVQSPLGQALLGRRKGDVFTVRLPRGEVEYELLDVRYGSGD